MKSANNMKPQDQRTPTQTKEKWTPPYLYFFEASHAQGKFSPATTELLPFDGPS